MIKYEIQRNCEKYLHSWLNFYEVMIEIEDQKIKFGKIHYLFDNKY